jgi:hypothetical protein
MVMDRAHAERFAAEWVASWNRRDVEAVLSHYADDAVFISPKAQGIAGTSRLSGKEPLRRYWTAALERIPSLTFTLDRVLWDPAASELAICYEADLNGAKSRAVEIVRFGPSGLLVQGEALHGAAL